MKNYWIEKKADKQAKAIKDSFHERMMTEVENLLAQLMASEYIRDFDATVPGKRDKLATMARASEETNRRNSQEASEM